MLTKSYYCWLGFIQTPSFKKLSAGKEKHLQIELFPNFQQKDWYRLSSNSSKDVYGLNGNKTLDFLTILYWSVRKQYQAI